MEQYYKSSGNVAPTAYLFFILASLTVLPLLALAYAYAIWYNPYPIINVALTVFFGSAVGYVIHFLLKIGKVRSGKWATLFCVFGALIALYLHWAVWVDLALNVSDTGNYSLGSEDMIFAKSNIKFGQVLNLLMSPKALFGIMSSLNEVGVWGFGVRTINGGLLSFIWIVEIVVVVLTALGVGAGQADKPFCELENKWFAETLVAPTAHFEAGPELVKAMANSDLDALGSMLKPAPADLKKEHHSKIILFDAATGENYVTVVNRVAKKNNKGQINVSDQPVVKFLKISQEVVNKLKQPLRPEV